MRMQKKSKNEFFNLYYLSSIYVPTCFGVQEHFALYRKTTFQVQLSVYKSNSKHGMASKLTQNRSLKFIGKQLFFRKLYLLKKIYICF